MLSPAECRALIAEARRLGPRAEARRARDRTRAKERRAAMDIDEVRAANLRYQRAKRERDRATVEAVPP